LKDSYGLELSTNSEEVVNISEQFRNELLSMAPGVTDILNHADAYEDSLIIQSYCAALWLYGQTGAADIEAGKYLDRARINLKTANDREKLLFSALESWGNRNLNDSALKLEKLISEWPKDLVSLKFLEFIYYLLGQEFSGPRFLSSLQKIYEPNKSSGYFLSSFSFALELCGKYDEALTTANRAVEINELNPWAHHTISHVYLKKGEIDNGTKILEDYEYIWEKSGQAINSHNNWHLALMYLENLDHNKAFAFIDEKILKDTPHLVIQQLDAISLLWRLEMGGFEVPYGIWVQIGKEIFENSKQSYIGFNSAHYIYALARAGMQDELKRSMELNKGFSKKISGSEQQVWDKIAIPLFEASAAFAGENYQQASLTLKPIIDNIIRVGGSDAQDDLFRQMYLVSLIKNKKKTESAQYLDILSTSPELTPLQEYWKSLI